MIGGRRTGVVRAAAVSAFTATAVATITPRARMPSPVPAFLATERILSARPTVVRWRRHPGHALMKRSSKNVDSTCNKQLSLALCARRRGACSHARLSTEAQTRGLFPPLINAGWIAPCRSAAKKIFRTSATYCADTTGTERRGLSAERIRRTRERIRNGAGGAKGIPSPSASRGVRRGSPSKRRAWRGWPLSHSVGPAPTGSMAIACRARRGVDGARR